MFMSGVVRILYDVKDRNDIMDDYISVFETLNTTQEVKTSYPTGVCFLTLVCKYD